MSKENARALIARLETDEDLRKSFAAAGPDGFEEAANCAGHPCTLHNLGEAVVEDGKLTIEELEQISAGGFKQHKDNPTSVPIGTPIALVYTSAALLFLPSILGGEG